MGIDQVLLFRNIQNKNLWRHPSERVRAGCDHFFSEAVPRHYTATAMQSMIFLSYACHCHCEACPDRAGPNHESPQVEHRRLNEMVFAQYFALKIVNCRIFCRAMADLGVHV